MNTVQLIFAFLGRLLAFVIALILCVPVILLPPATAVPAWVWIPLAAAGCGAARPVLPAQARLEGRRGLTGGRAPGGRRWRSSPRRLSP